MIVMKKWLKISLLSVLGLIIVAGVLTWMEFGSIIQGALSAEKLDDVMYYMEYKGYEPSRPSPPISMASERITSPRDLRTNIWR